MLISKLIEQLQDIASKWTKEDEEYLGPPQVGFDVFRLKYPGSANYDRVYGGICDGDIVIEHTKHWCYPVITTFAECYEDPTKTKEQATESHRACVAWPKSWET